MKILLAGDIHSSRYHTRYLFNIVKTYECELIIALGDFSFFPNLNYHLDFLNEINHLAADHGIQVWWLDGNHENHDYIASLTNGANDRRFVTATDYKIWENLYYLPRGYTFELDSIKFMSYGGAYSIDRPRRVKFVTWFPQEMIDLDHVKSLPDTKIDVLLSHDVPEGYDFGYDELSIESLTSSQARLALLELVKKTKPSYAFGGHHHLRADYTVTVQGHKTKCYILNCDRTHENSWAIIDTEKLKVALNKTE